MLPTPQTLAEAVAIVKSVAADMGVQASRAALEKVALWAIDLTHAYRMLAVQRSEWPQQAYVWLDGVRLDKRCVFGTASMVNLFQRVSSFALAVAQERIRAYDRQHPYPEARQQWSAWRARHLSDADGGSPAVSTIYLDDGLGLSVHGETEPLRGRADGGERPVHAATHCEPGASGGVHVALMVFADLSRGQTHLAIVERTFQQAGWDIAASKIQLGWSITELGIECTSAGDGALAVPEEKRRGLLEDIRDQQPEPEGRLQRGKRVERELVEALTGRCLHIAQIASEANPYLAPMYRMQEARVTVRRRDRTTVRIKPATIDVAGDAHAQHDYQQALRWWASALENGISAPLAPRLTLPALDQEGVAFMFTDAAREAGTGHGAFTVIRRGDDAVFLYDDPRWSPATLLELQSNVLSMPAGEGIGAIAFADALAEELEGLTCLYIFTDSIAVVAAVQSNNSPSPQLNCMVRWLFERHPRVQFVAMHQPGVRNVAADGRSRASTSAVLQSAAKAGLALQRLTCMSASESLTALARAAPQRRP